MNTQNKFIYSIVLCIPLICLGLISCNKERPIKANCSKAKYIIKDSSDPIDHLIYDIYKTSGIEIIYNFKPEDAKWNLGNNNPTSSFTSADYIPIDINNSEKKEYLLKNLEMLRDKFLNLYPISFKSKYFPLRIFICDSIGNKRKQLDVGRGRDHIAVNIRGNDDKLNEADYTSKIIPQLHAVTWRYIFSYVIEVPDNFKAFSAELYDKNIEGSDNPKYNIKSDGFWTYNELLSFKFKKANTLEKYVEDYIIQMTSRSEQKNMELMKGYDIMINKYNILRNFIKAKIGFDIQEIGNNTDKQI